MGFPPHWGVKMAITQIMYNFGDDTGGASLINDVASRAEIAIPPTASTTPTLEEIKMWLNLGQLDVANKAINEVLKTLWEDYDFEANILGGGDTRMSLFESMSGWYVGTLPADFLRPVRIEFWDMTPGVDAVTDGTFSRDKIYETTLMDAADAESMVRDELFRPSKTRPVVWVWDDQLHVLIGASETIDMYPHNPAGSGSYRANHDRIRLKYIKEPNKLVNNTDQTMLPAVFQDYMIQFAVIRAKIQEGRNEEIPTLKEMYEGGITTINQTTMVTTKYGITGRS